MHHSAERLDTCGAFYFSPLDIVGFTALSSLARTMVGLPPTGITYYLYFTMFLAVIQHTNVHTPQWLRYIVQRPESHSVHHDRELHHHKYSDLPLFDILFGTFRNPREYIAEAEFAGGRSAQIAGFCCRDIGRDDYEQSVRLPARAGCEQSGTVRALRRNDVGFHRRPAEIQSGRNTRGNWRS